LEIKYEEDIILFLNSETLEQFKMCVNKARPNEACGLVFGEINENRVSGGFQYHYFAKKFNCIESSKKSSVEFLIGNPEELNQIFYEASQKYKLRLISIFHSHPSGAHPSGFDLENMKYLDEFDNKAFRNQIWSIMDASNYNLNSFIYLNKELKQINVKIQKK